MQFSHIAMRAFLCYSFTMSYEGYTEKRKASNKRYMDKQARVVVWCSPDDKKEIETAAAAANESVNGYIKKAVRDRMEK